jgi:predicted ABC-type ATPase
VSRRRIIIGAGPKGADKATFAPELLPNEAGCPIFVNADLIAAELAGAWSGKFEREACHDRPILR